MIEGSGDTYSVLLRRSTSLGEGGVGYSPYYIISVPIAASHLWFGPRTWGDMVGELDGRELRSMIAVALNDTER